MSRVFFFLFLVFSSPALAADAGTKASLIAAQTGVVAGKPLSIGLLLEHAPGWHSYWENPGEAGLPASLTWQLPDDFTASDIHWPPPKRFVEDKLVVYGYEDTVLLPVTLTVPEKLSAKEYTLKAKAEWLACNNICIPESAELSLTLPVVKKAVDSSSAKRFADIPAITSVSEKLSATASTTAITITFDAPEGIQSAYFFPRTPGRIAYSQDQILQNNMLTLTKSSNDDEGEITGLLSITDAEGARWLDVSFDPPAAPAPTVSELPTPPPAPLTFWAALVLALLGGVVLNLMPCVLPVLSLKAFAIAKKAGKRHAHVAQLGIAYTLGVLISFAVIAGLLISLQQAGQAVGWGYQMQSRGFVGFLIFLLFLTGLNLSGMFELPVLLGNVGDDLANETSKRGYFFTGVLATLVATPCTAPFMASAVGVALTLPAWQSMLIFLALGFGLALPFLLISLFPIFLHLLPRPGAWMITFRQFLAFPMYASAIWLLWVLTLQIGAGGMVWMLGGLLAIIFALWLGDPLMRLLLLALTISTVLPNLESSPTTGPAVTSETSQINYSPAALADLRAKKKPVFVDATAAWCITCQINKSAVLENAEIKKTFADNGVVFMVADWTLRNPEITAFLTSFGYQGVPLYVYYPPGGEGIVLPQILSKQSILNLLAPSPASAPPQ